MEAIPVEMGVARLFLAALANAVDDYRKLRRSGYITADGRLDVKAVLKRRREAANIHPSRLGRGYSELHEIRELLEFFKPENLEAYIGSTGIDRVTIEDMPPVTVDGVLEAIGRKV